MHIALRILNQMAPAYLQILQTITLFLALLQIPFKMHVLAEWKSRLAMDICYAQIAGKHSAWVPMRCRSGSICKGVFVILLCYLWSLSCVKYLLGAPVLQRIHECFPKREGGIAGTSISTAATRADGYVRNRDLSALVMTHEQLHNPQNRHGAGCNIEPWSSLV